MKARAKRAFFLAGLRARIGCSLSPVMLAGIEFLHLRVG
jgi:hypothetical protein